MSEPSTPPNIPWPEPSADSRRSRRRFSLKSMRSLFLLVLLIAGLLGGASEFRRRHAVNQLIDQLSRCRSDITAPTIAAGTFGPRIRRIRALHGEYLAVDSVIRSLHDADESHDYATAQAAIACLLQMEPESTRAVPELISLITEKDFPSQPGHRWRLKQTALHALGRLGRNDETGTVVAALREVLADPLKGRMELIVVPAIEVLEAIGPLAQDAAPDLARLASHSNPRIRLSSLVALGRIGPAADSAIPAILAALKDPDEQVRAQGVISLSQIAHADERIFEIMTTVTELARNDSEVRDVAELTLKRLGRKRQLAENRASLLPHLAPEARERFLKAISVQDARAGRRRLR